MAIENTKNPFYYRSNRLSRVGALGLSSIALAGFGDKAESAVMPSGQAAASAEVYRLIAAKAIEARNPSLEDYQSIIGALSKANRSRDPNVMYGAVSIIFKDKPASQKTGIYASANKNPSKRLPKTGYSTVVLMDPVCEVYNGRKYLIGTDRGWQDASPANYNPLVKDASSDMRNVKELKTRFIDYNDIVKRGALISWYLHNGSHDLKLVRSEIRDGMRFIKDNDQYPQYNPTGSFVYEFPLGINPKNPIDIDGFLENKGFVGIGDSHTPEFDR